MQLGIFCKTFVGPTLSERLDAVRSHGLQCMQFNMACAGLEPLPSRIDSALCAEIRQAVSERNLRMAAVSGTFNMIHPDPAQRQEGLRRLRELAAACPAMGTSIVTLCTGSRDPHNPWRRHPDNDLPAAWRDLVASLRAALQLTEDSGVTLAFEPEVSNVVDSARKGRRLLDEIGSPRLKVVMDAANLFHAGELGRMHEVLDEAFDLLGPEIVVAHAKDLSRDGAAGDVAAGEGVLDYDYYLHLLHSHRFTGPLILHGLTQPQVAGSVAFIEEKLRRLPTTCASGELGGPL